MLIPLDLGSGSCHIGAAWDPDLLPRAVSVLNCQAISPSSNFSILHSSLLEDIIVS